ncbi:MAG: UDP-3-O-(3-hydroxymyristoyl)glucosamine N-acyltransferase [Kiritimatiellae bacterium]|nr:UDP-3-O-(3-hydroxymyristoyl)glucosamine N-acyltransferase [Kiritimatiellia bacterium]
MAMTVRELAAKLNGRVEGDESQEIHALASLREARAGDLSFLHEAKYERQLSQTRATAVLVAEDWAGESSAKALIRVADPNGAFAQAAPWFAPPEPMREPGIHPTAVIAPTAKLGEGVYVGPWTVVEDGAVVGDGCVIEAQVFIGQRVVMGRRCHIYPQVTVREGCTMGDRCILHCGVRIGGDGYGYNPVFQPDGTIRVDKIPQLGIVELGNDVEVGSNTTIDRARFGRTRIGNSTKIDNLVQIGHNVQVGDYSGLIAQSGIAGSARIGNGCLVWAQAGVSGHIEIHDRAQVGPQAGVSKDVPSGTYFLGTPASPKKEFAATLLIPREVAKLRKQVAELKQRLEALESGRDA